MLAVVGLFVLAGCEEQEQIHTYTVTKVKPPPLSELQGMGQDGVPEPTRMLGAILTRADKTWFFKLTAPPDEAAALREEFGKFVASTRFENGEPTWEIPAHWTEQKQAPDSIRLATFEVSPGGPEVTITPLGKQDDLENVNRWRRQLGLSQLSAKEYQRALESDDDAKDVFPEDEGEVVTITTPAGKAVLIDFVGEMASGGGPPFANMARSPAGPVGPPQFGPAAPAQAESGTPRLNPPDTWKEAELDAFSTAAFQAGEGDDACRITVSSVGGNLLVNVNRWRGQAGLSGWSAAELAKEKQTLSGKGYTADYFELTGPAETILAAVIVHNGRPWIVKLRGPNEAAAAQTGNFKQFVQSIEF